MPSKAEFYRQMAEQVSTQLVGSWKEWTAFLTTAARLYKYPFHEQMMIYAQRPDATACAEYDLWNEKMGRYVRRGSKGIALVDDSGDKLRLRYVFDISDTGTREHSRTPWLWQLEEQHIGPVSAMLEQNYGVAGDNLAQQLTDVAGKLASEYWDDHQRDFRYADNRLDTESAVKAVLEKFGSERVQFILANTIQHKDSDGRVSRDNKAWAKTIPMPEDSGTSRHCAYLVVDEVNLGLTDLFTRQARKTLQEPEKGSVLQKLKQEPTTHKPALSKKQEPER